MLYNTRCHNSITFELGLCTLLYIYGCINCILTLYYIVLHFVCFRRLMIDWLRYFIWKNCSKFVKIWLSGILFWRCNITLTRPWNRYPAFPPYQRRNLWVYVGIHYNTFFRFCRKKLKSLNSKPHVPPLLWWKGDVNILWTC